MIKVGISACVLGDKVRFDGGHKKSGYVVSYLSKVFDFVPVCPEVGIGMSVPRPAIRVVDAGDTGLRLTDSKDVSLDYTDKLDDFYEAKHASFSQLDGYILAAKSPTCGVERIKVYSTDGDLLHRKGQGLFARQIRNNYPDLPMEEDGRLNDPGLRESFITKVYVHHRLREQVLGDPSAAALMQFHAQHKFLVMAYSPQNYQALGRLVAQAGSRELASVIAEYKTLLMRVFDKPTNRKKHTNVLMHLQGFFKRDLSKSDKQELVEQIDKYRRGHLPLMAPVTLLKHYLKEYPNPYLASQVYLDPFPDELGLRA